MTNRPTKAELDAIEAQDAQVEDEYGLDDLGDMYIQLGFQYDEDYADYIGPVFGNPVENEVSTNASQEDWKEFLRKIEEDLS